MNERMIELLVLLCSPVFFAACLALIGHKKWAAKVNIAGSGITFLAAFAIADRVLNEGAILLYESQFYIDHFAAFLIVLTSFVGLTTALFSSSYVKNEVENKRLTPLRLRLYHSMYQLFIATMLLALSTNNIGILWVAIEAATLSTLLIVALYRTPESLAAAWKYFILCGVGIAQALFGTILIYFAANQILGDGQNALLWTQLSLIKADLNPTVLSLAFVFILIGYGTKAGLVPLHNWLADAHAEGPTPISAVLSGLLLNVALFAILRTKTLTDVALGTEFAGRLMMGFGLLTLLVAAFYLSRQKDVKRLFSFSSIEHIGLIVFAFGLGSPIASFAGVLHMAMHSLTKSAIFFSVGSATQLAGTQTISSIKGLIKTAPFIGWSLILGTFAIVGMPPFGVFASEFLMLKSAVSEALWTIPLLFTGLIMAFAVLFSRVQEMCFGEENLTYKPLVHKTSRVPIILHLALVLVLGFWMPTWLSDWIIAASQILGRF